MCVKNNDFDSKNMKPKKLPNIYVLIDGQTNGSTLTLNFLLGSTSGA